MGKAMKSTLIAKRGHVEVWKHEDKGDSTYQVKTLEPIYKDLSSLGSNEVAQVSIGLVLSAYRIDAHGDFYDPIEIERAAHDYLESSSVVGMQHSGKQRGAAVVESFLMPYPTQEDHDKAMSGEPHRVVKWVTDNGVMYSGDWIMGTRHMPDVWADVKAGKVTGKSPGFYATMGEETTEAPPVTEVIELDMRSTGEFAMNKYVPKTEDFFTAKKL
jgi:hypothetical protein